MSLFRSFFSALDFLPQLAQLDPHKLV